jgi:signal transduction histidine kinase
MQLPKKKYTGFSPLQAAGWIVDARWYYMLLVLLLVLIARNENDFQGASMILVGMFFCALFLNLFFYIFLRRTDQEKLSGEAVNFFNVGQVALDLVLFFVVLLFTGGGVESIGHSFFFIPIVASMVLFGFRGAITVAVLSGLLVLLSVLVHAGVGNMLLHVGIEKIYFTKELSLALSQAGIIFLIFLVTGFFCGYVSRLHKARDLLFFDQIKREEDHVSRLELLTTEFDQSAKLLVRRDLELSKVNEKLTQLDRMKSEIISIVAHQLRTPLSAVKWTLNILLDEDMGKIVPAQRDLLVKGFESNERMITLINDMLEVDRLESGKLKYNFVPVQFEGLVEDMIRSLLPLATQKNIRVEFKAPEQPLQKIKIDPDKMREVLQNLIDNAIKYTKEGSVVDVGVAMEGAELHFSVKDNGIGIPDEEKDQIFSRFFRAANAVRTQTNGSGLGLFIAQSVVKRHGGKIWFESTLDEGTTFHMVLPYSI